MSELDGSAAAPPPLAPRILAEQIRMIVLQTPQGVAGPAALGAIGALVSWQHVAALPLVLTLIALTLTLGSWLFFFHAFRREDPAPTAIEAWARGTLVRTLAHGACWGAYSLVVFQADSVVYQSVDVAFMYGLVAGAVVVDGPHFRTFAAFALPTLLPVVVRCFFAGTTASIAVGSAGLVGLVHGLFAAHNAFQLTARSIRAQLENLDLMRELERQSQLAERAKERAEAANREKSRFLAAASHDLRQPVHALGLFAAAAERSRSNAERQHILEQIGRTVASLSELFDSLFEISRLDAGVIEPRVVTIRVKPVLERLAAELAPEAGARGLTLRVRARELDARTDPLLFERIIRNVLTNALRYTERGGVLLTCRRRRDRVRVEVWDTGIGIAKEHQAQVFEPFFQVGNSERDRRQGVGLGLSIVERLASMLGHRLQLHSRLGRGSCVALELSSRGASSEAPAPEAPLGRELEHALLGCVVVVIDDDAAVLTAVEALLKQFGCHVIGAPSAERALVLLRASDVVPDAVLADFRLRDGETGVHAIAALRGVYGAELAAAIVTGDTAPERLHEIGASRLLALHKPVPPDVLERTLVELMG